VCAGSPLGNPTAKSVAPRPSGTACAEPAADRVRIDEEGAPVTALRGLSARAGRAAAAAFALMLPLAGCTATSTQVVVSNTANLAVPAGLAKYYEQKLAWTSCDEGFQCSTLKVPLDYTHPDGTQIGIAVVRKQATDPGQRLGSLLVNPGGPGGSGIQYATSPGVVSAAVQARYDLIGFDPRGVDQSDPVQCLSSAQMDAFVSIPSDPDTSAEQQQVVNESKFFAAQCEAKSGSLLPFVGTQDAARDMDVLRAALGDAKLNYLGKSYGTYLGAVYAQEFPKNVGHMVLDGALDPSLSSEQLNITQAAAFDAELRQYLAGCAKTSGCPFSGDVTADVTQLKTWVNSLQDHPIQGDNTRKLDEALAMTGVALAMYDQNSWPQLTQALRAGFQGDGSELLQMADEYNNRVAGQFVGNEAEANFAVNCVDHPDEATSVQQIEQALPAYEKAAPFFGEMVDWSGLPCAYWGAKPTNTPQKISASGAAPILVVGTTRDPATPYAWAQGLATQLASGHLLTMDGDGHTAYLRGSTCIDSDVDAYLISGTLPAQGTVCRQTQ
jgi:pimeloyl-ACP methyl ester carboxylesterase